MPVVDVITELNIKADTSPVEQLNKAIGGTTQEIARLTKQNEALITQEKRLANQGVSDRKAINNLIDQNRRKIETLTASMGKQIVTSEKLQQTVKRTAGQFNSLSFSIGNILRDAPYGFNGIANNIGPAFDDLQRRIKQLQSEGKPTSAVFLDIGKSLLGFSNIVNLAVLGLQLFGDKLFRSAKAAKEAKSEYDKFIESLGNNSQQALKNTDEQVTKLEVLRGVIEKGGKASVNAIRQLRNEYPDLTKGISDADLAQGRANKTFDAIKTQIAAKERSNALTKDAAEVTNQERIARGKLNEINDKINKSLARENELQKEIDIRKARQRPGDERLGISTVTQLNQQRNATAALRAQAQLAQTAVDNLSKTRERLTNTAISQGVQGSTLLFPDEKVKEETKDINELAKALKEVSDELSLLSAREYVQFLDDIDDANAKKLKQIEEDFKSLNESFTKNLKQGFGSQLTTGEAVNLEVQLAEFTPEAKEQRKKAQEEAAKERKDNIEAAVQGYQTLASEVGDIFDRIYSRQIESLDRQIQVTRERIDVAVELAKAGNAQILQEETNRLDALEKKREEIAQKQLQTNALLRASSAAIAAAQAIQVVTNAGATGDPYTTAARIAAAVAALAAGISFATSITEAFADGVVDYQGKGTGKSDSNIVRISKGESVITADATQKFKPMLEAMNAGTFTAMPVYNSNVSRHEMDGVNNRLDSLIEAVSMSSTKVNFNASPDGIRIMTETARRRDQNRFRR